MTLAFTGALNPVIVLVLVGLMGLVRPSDLGLRAALIADTMPAEHADRRDGYLAHHLGFRAHRRRADRRRAGRGLGMGPTYIVIASSMRPPRS